MSRIKKLFLSEWTYRIGRWFYAAVFLYAGVTKLLDPRSFAVVIEAFGLVPQALAMPVAIFLPLLEIIAALGLILDIRGSLILTAGLLVAFLLIVGYGIWLGLDIDCGCFGPGDPEAKAYKSLRPTFYRDMVLILGILILFFHRFIRTQQTVCKRNLLTKTAKNNKRRMSNEFY